MHAVIYAGIIIVLLPALVILAAYILLERSILPRNSTRQFASLSPMPLGKLLEGYFYAARPAWYLKPATWTWFRHLFMKAESADTYHGKVMTLGDAGKIIKLDQPVGLYNLDKVVPYPVAQSIILSQPLKLAVMECPCRAQKESSCPRDVCLVVGEPFVSFVVEHSPEKARRIETGEALQILQEEEERGHIHTAWFKDAMHGRFYTICNCCTCCCLGMASYFRGVPRMAHSGYQPSVDTNNCIGCGNCHEICPYEAITLVNDTPALNSLCMGCGLCVSHCPVQAIELNPAAEKGVPLDLELLIPDNI
ncbi:MAG TPA: 4Fe-4S binding protein [Syntrophomonadaceae bacterium]|nr:4Fe-4S binding protein [Syntrophomonadaceae bacterium]